MVKDKRMPSPVEIGRRLIWDVRRLDEAFDALSDKAPGGRDAEPPEDDDPLKLIRL